MYNVAGKSAKQTKISMWTVKLLLNILITVCAILNVSLQNKYIHFNGRKMQVLSICAKLLVFYQQIYAEEMAITYG